MAFVTASPTLTRLSLAPRLPAARGGRPRHAAAPTRMASSSPPPPPSTREAPTPRLFYVRPDNALKVLGGSLGMAVRGGAGALVAGYKPSMAGGTFSETSSVLPATRPAKPLVVYEFTACPFCRKVREALSMVDVDVVVKPTPKGETTHRGYVTDVGGKAMFPYLEDPNTGWAGYESDAIVKYLYETYADGSVPLTLSLGGLTTLTAGAASALRGMRGSKAEDGRQPPGPELIELWAYEPSPYCKVVSERLCELGLPYLLHTTARGSVKRAQLKELTGRFQVPYLVDPNTGVAMFESASIVDYLNETYGPGGSGVGGGGGDGSGGGGGSDGGTPVAGGPTVVATAVTTAGGATAVTTAVVEDVTPVVPVAVKPEAKDEVLEKLCKETPESDECRVYDS
ncbi:hypothetical protein MMPV_005835 [Pyropia vietnamensis]